MKQPVPSKPMLMYAAYASFVLPSLLDSLCSTRFFSLRHPRSPPSERTCNAFSRQTHCSPLFRQGPNAISRYSTSREIFLIYCSISRRTPDGRALIKSTRPLDRSQTRPEQVGTFFPFFFLFFSFSRKETLVTRRRSTAAYVGQKLRNAARRRILLKR